MAQIRTARYEVEVARQRLREDRTAGLAALDALFSRGALPDPPLEGRYHGEFITTCLHPWFDPLARLLARVWMPWKGKTFSAAAQVGDNVFSSSGLWLARLVWSGYRGFVPDGPELTRAFQFRTYSGAGQLDPGVQVLKIDYDWEANPRFLIRDVLDELVQVGEGYYLGKALLRQKPGQFVCAGYFALSPI